LRSQTVWKWVDERASRTTPISPCPARPRSSALAAIVDRLVPTPAPSPLRHSAARAVTRYRRLRDLDAERDQTIQQHGRPGQRRVASIRRCSEAHADLYLDGTLVDGFPRNSLSYSLTDVPRGSTRSLQRSHDANGKTIQERSRRVHCAAGVDRESAAGRPRVRPPKPNAARCEQDAARSRATRA
jgi:hypothetical protein